MTATTTPPSSQAARPRGRPPRAAAPCRAAPTCPEFAMRSVRHAYENGNTVEVFWRAFLDESAERIARRRAETAAHLAEIGAQLKDIESQVATTQQRYKELTAVAADVPARVAHLTAEVAAGRAPLEDLITLQARAEAARILLPDLRAAQRDLGIKAAELNKDVGHARNELRDLTAVDTWQNLQAALAPAHEAITAWFNLTGDEALWIAGPTRPSGT